MQAPSQKGGTDERTWTEGSMAVAGPRHDQQNTSQTHVDSSTHLVKSGLGPAGLEESQRERPESGWRMWQRRASGKWELGSGQLLAAGLVDVIRFAHRPTDHTLEFWVEKHASRSTRRTSVPPKYM